MNIGKVIVTCFVPRGERPSHGTTHAQNLPSPDSVLQMIKRTVETEKRIDAGMPMDTIIVNNDEGFIDGREFLDSINETPTKNGRFKVMHRENYGRSFGGYNHAFEKYKDQYEYWIFNEDDMYYCKDGYAREYLNILNNNENCAFIATIGKGRDTNHPLWDEWIRAGTAGSPTTHAHGGSGFTHRNYMEETIPTHHYWKSKQGRPIRSFAGPNCLQWLRNHDIDLDSGMDTYKAAGSLAHYTGKSSEENKNTRIHCVVGEVPFTYSLVKLGYDIITPENPEQWYQYHF